jgi:Zn finger protein HypA/HybF involved in hydrogenase expression
MTKESIKKKKQEESVEEQGTPICKKCGNAMVLEAEEWMCPHCQGEIDFLGGDDDE